MTHKKNTVMNAKVKAFFHKLGVLTTVIPLSFVPCYAQAQIVVSGTVDIHFGSMTENGAGGTMAIDIAGARTAGGGVTAVSGSGFEKNGVISVGGTTGVAIDLSITGAPFTVTGPGAAMSVSGFNLVTNVGGSNQTITLTTNPSTYPVGATLTVGAGQVAGSYIGTYTVNATLQ